MVLPRVLVIAGSDSGGGAGIQADIRTIMALGGYAMTAITALTAQNTLGVHAVLPVPADFVRAQIDAVLDDLGADAVKTGMLGSADTILAVAAALSARAARPLVVDPVMVAKGGAALLDPGAIDALCARLLPQTTVLTPNVPEAHALTGLSIDGEDGMVAAALALRDMGAQAVLVKGGHLPGDPVIDVLATASTVVRLAMPRLRTRHTHGTGCTLASAIAAGLAARLPLEFAVRRARAYVQAAIAAAPGLGQGHGPLQHAVRVEEGG